MCQSVGDFGELLFGVGAIGLVLLGFYASRQWKIQKSLERKSEWALVLEEKLNCFEHELFDLWEFIFWVYERRSTGNVNRLNGLDEEGKKKFLDQMEIDPYELKNYSKKIRELKDVLEDIAVRGKSLDQDIPALVEELRKIISNKEQSLSIYLFINATNEQKSKAYETLSDEEKDSLARKFVLDIRKKLLQHIFFEN